MLEEGVSDHRHKRMTVKALPGSSLEVVKTELFFHLLVSLLANPTRLDGGCQQRYSNAATWSSPVSSNGVGSAGA